MKNMILDFLQTESKLVLTWAGSGVVVWINKFGLNMTSYDLWKLYLIDGLTVLSLLVAIGYTIARWHKLHK